MFLNELQEFVTAYGQRIQEKLYANRSFPSYCEHCGEETIPMRENTCKLCGHWQATDDD
jgi:hypothetical protein